MAKLYYTKDIKKLINQKIERDSAALVNDKDMSEENLFRFVRDLRIFKKYADELIEEMIEDDRREDEYLASVKASLNSKIKEEEEKPSDK